MRILLCLWLVVALLSSGSATANGGDVHGTPPVALPSAAVPGLETRESHSELYELLIKYSPPVPGEKTHLGVFLSDYRTNEPVAGATIELEMGDVKVTAKPGQSPGFYVAEVTFPGTGTFEPIVSISRGDSSDLLTLPEITVGTPAAGTTGSPRWLIPAAVTAVALLLILLLLIRWRRARSHWLKGEPVA